MDLNESLIEEIGKRIEWYKNLKPEEKLLGNRALAGSIAQDDLANVYSLYQITTHTMADLCQQLAAKDETLEKAYQSNRETTKLWAKQIGDSDEVIGRMKEALKIAAPAVLANLNHFWSRQDVDKFKQALAGERSEE